MSDAKKGRAKAALAELAAETEGEQLIQFAVAKRLPYGLRALLVLGLALGGVWAQAATLNPGSGCRW